MQSMWNSTNAKKHKETIVPWYKVKHRGPKLQVMWQSAVGISLALGLVIIPLAVQLHQNEMRKQRKLDPVKTSTDFDLLLQAEINKFRADLAEEAKASKSL